MFYVECTRNIVFRVPLKGATNMEEAQKLVDNDCIDYDSKEIIDDDFEVLEIHED